MQMRKQLPHIPNGNQTVAVTIRSKEILFCQTHIVTGILGDDPAEQNRIRSGTHAVAVDISPERFC